MPVLQRQLRKTEKTRFSANVALETKAMLEDYAYRKRVTLAVALDTLLREALERKDSAEEIG